MKKVPVVKVDISGSIQMYDGIWYRADSPEITECCDCGLVHITEYMMENGRLFWRARVDKRATNASRKRNKIRVVKDVE